MTYKGSFPAAVIVVHPFPGYPSLTSPSTRFPTRKGSRIASASLVGLEPPLAITPLLILRVTVSTD